MYIFSTILNHSWANQKTSIIREYKSRCLNCLFQNQCALILLSPLFKEYLNSLVKINEKAKDPSVEHRPSPWGLTSADTLSHIFRDNLGFYLSLEWFLSFLSNLYIPPQLWKSFKFIVFILLENLFARQKIESRHFH